MQTDNELSPTVEGFVIRARNIPVVDIPHEVRDAAKRLQTDVVRCLSFDPLSDEDATALRTLVVGLDVLSRGRAPFVD